LKKITLFLTLVALCMILYDIAAVYANISTAVTLPTTSKPSLETTNDYNTPINLPNMPRPYGDPNDSPKPKMIRKPSLL